MVDPINAKMTGMPPGWMSRVNARSTNVSNATEIRKMLGEPIPRMADLSKVSAEVAAMFAPNGLLERLRKKLAQISKRKQRKKKKGGRFIPAHNTIACVDENDNVYVGVEFLAAHGENEDLVAGILAHEWGHMLSDVSMKQNLSHLNWDQLYALRRDEEAYADGFAGRATRLMGYSVEPMIEMLNKLEKKRNPKLPLLKYFNTATREAILKASYAAIEEAFDIAHKLNFKTTEFVGQG